MKTCVICSKSLHDNLAYIRCYDCEVDWRDHGIFRKRTFDENLELASYDQE